MDTLKIIEFKVEDWEIYKLLRLESLNDSPDSFGSTYEREDKFTDQEWISRLVPNEGIVRLLPLAALSSGKPIGLAVGAIHSAKSETGHIYQMWVSKSYRGRGIGKQLLKRIEVWATYLVLKSLSLAVTTSNFEAVSLYKSLGFIPSSSTEPLRENSALSVQPMVLGLKSCNA